jgi:hypothetical protein
MKIGVIVSTLSVLVMLISCTAAMVAGDEGGLPKGISCTQLPDGHYQYLIKGIYAWKSLEDTLKYCPEYQKDEIPGCIDMEIDVGARTMKFVTEKKIGKLRELIDRLAGSGGCVPTWTELQMRDRQSTDYSGDLYRIAFEKKIDFPGALAVSSMERLPEGGIKVTCYSKSGDLKTNQAVYVLVYKDRQYTLRQVGKVERIEWPDHSVMSREPESEHVLKYDKGSGGTLKFNPSTAYCMCHSRYAMRVFDESGEFIWDNQDKMYGDYYPLVFDFQNDGIDEIIIFREDHGEESLLIFERKK